MSTESFIRREADRCVKCGLCLPHCPTYGLLQDEGDSPRGRIALMQGLVDGQLTPSPRLELHLDRCLACRACERVCPSGVEYGALLTATRNVIEQRRPLGWRRRLARRLGNHFISSMPARRRLYPLLRLAELTGLRALARSSGLLGALGLTRAEQLLPAIPRQTTLPAYSPAAGSARGDVALFTGCVGPQFDGPALQAAIRLLNAAGYGVHVPPTQNCCGALHLHRGLHDEAAALAAHTAAVFNALPVTALIHAATGCGATLNEYPLRNDDDNNTGAADAGRLQLPVREIGEFLAAEAGERLRFKPLAQRALLHTPCTQWDASPTLKLLRRIPQLSIEPLPGSKQCCGAAGSYMLTQPVLADRLRDATLAQLAGDAPLLLTSNIGCALHLGAGLRQSQRDTQVQHPVVLLAQQLE
ncbi:MAG: 4Fe-4S dicluster domain-containing protein [Gammaproteobacteria bacterium]|nr:4Fe-4S dicluster domain-containing protein [Gammaproteobacteria bacterium]